jgi:hypothetical protein
MVYRVRDVAGLAVRDKADEYYEHEANLVFENRTGREGEMGFAFLWDVAEGFDESDVSFDKPGVTYEVSAVREGWRRLTVRCEGFDLREGLTAKFLYSADALSVSDAALGYYRWDLDEYTEKDIPELDRAIASFDSPYACADWIIRNIDYGNLSENPQPAAETFRNGRGDCDDMAILFCYMARRLFPEAELRLVEGWASNGDYHANVALRTDEGWLMLDPAMSSTQFGVFDFGPFVPAGLVSPPFCIRDSAGNEAGEGKIGIAFGPCRTNQR